MSKKDIILYGLILIYMCVMFSIPLMHDLKDIPRKRKSPTTNNSKWQYVISLFTGIEKRE